MDTELKNVNQEMLNVKEEKSVENTPCENTDSYMEIEIDTNEPHLEKDDFHSQNIDNLNRKIDTGLQKIRQRQQNKDQEKKVEIVKSCFENVDCTPCFDNTVSNVHDVDRHNNIESTVRNIKQEVGTSKETLGNLPSGFPKNDNVYIFENTDSQCEDKANVDYGMCVDIIKIKQETEDYQEQIPELGNTEYPKDIDLESGSCKREDSHDSTIDSENSHANIEFNLKSENEPTCSEKRDTMLTHPDVRPDLNTVTLPQARHEVTPRTDRPHQCSMCGKKFKRIPELRSHMTTHSSERPHKCSMCGKGFKCTVGLRCHMISHSTERPYQCNMCGQGFKMNNHLKSHMVTHTTERPHQCNMCDERFKCVKSLRRHILTHTTERPHQCNVCSKEFKGMDNLRKHMISHSTERPHQCNFCDKGFKALRHLKEHMIIHSPERSYQCKVCDKVFKRSNHLRSHMITHSTDRPHQCDVCNKDFKRPQDLREHMTTHSTEQPFQCNVCNKAFKAAKNLKNHMICHSAKAFSIQESAAELPTSSN